MSVVGQNSIAVTYPEIKETSCKATRAIIEYIRRQYVQTYPSENPDEIIHELLKDFPYPTTRLPYTQEYLTEINNWVELDASDELFERARILLQDENITYKIAAETPNFRGFFGFTEHLARVVGPEIAMRRTPRLQRALQGTSHLELTRITPTEAEVKITYHQKYRAALRRDSCDFARGILSAVPQFAGAEQPARLKETQCTVPIYRRGVIDGCFHIRDDQDHIWQFAWPFTGSGDQIPLPARSFLALDNGRFEFKTRRGKVIVLTGKKIGQLDNKGCFSLNGIKYGADNCIYQLNWVSLPWLMRWFNTIRSLLPGGWREETLAEREHRLHEMAGQVSSLELAVVYDDIVKRLVVKNSIFKAKVVILTEFEPQTEVLVVRAVAMDVWETAISRLGKIDTAIIGRYLSLHEHSNNLAVMTIKNNQPLAETDDLKRLFSPLLDEDTCRDLEKRVHWVGTLPLRYEGQLLGSLLVATGQRQRLTGSEKEALLRYARRATTEIQNASQYRRRVAELEQLQRINRDISSTLKLDQVLQRILTEAKRLLRVSYGRILLLDPQTESWIAQVGEPLPDDKVKSEISALISENERVIGRIEIQSERLMAFDSNDNRLLATLAGQAAIAIQNAQHHEELLQERDSRVNAEISAAMADLSSKMIHRMRNHLGGARSDVIELKEIYVPNVLQAIQADTPPIIRTSDLDDIDVILEEVVYELDAALAMLENLRKPFKIETGPVSVKECLEKELQELGDHPPVEINVDKSVAHLPPVTGSLEHLSEVFHILLNNALAAIEDGGQISIAGQVGRQDGRVRVRVSDTGAGMEPNILSQIFNYGFTTKDTNKKSAGGYGFGLWWVKTYLQRKELGGDIYAQSTPGKGTEFTLILAVWPEG